MNVHEKIRFLRKSKHWSQDEMAEKLDMSISGYAKIEQGKSEASLAKLEQIAEIFEIDVLELLSLGEKSAVVLMGDNNSGSWLQVVGTSKELVSEIEKLQLINELKDKELIMQQREIALLEQKIADQQKIITLLENKS
jgi:transcriptional regulator with XRE-family HTH domain